MLEVRPITVEIKTSAGHEDQHCLVHDSSRVIALAPPGVKITTPASNTMVMGPKEELEAEIDRLNLTPLPPRQTLVPVSSRPT